MTTPPLDDILDSLVVAVLRLDADGALTYLNPAAADMLETGQRHARGRRLAELMPLDEELAGYLERARRQGEPLAVAELEILCGPPPGRRRRVSCDIAPLDHGGAQLELRLLDRRQQIAEESGLWQGHQAQRLLLQALAHEIKNPLGGLRGAAQLLNAELGERPELGEYLEVMLRETGRLRDLVDSLLGPARPLKLHETNIHAVLEHVRQLLQPGAPEEISWQRDFDPSLPTISADADQLIQVFLNLTGNALQALGERGLLRLRTRIERQYTLGGRRHRMALRVDVEDNGPGIPETIREALFLPLVTGRADGSGLGLAIAQDIVQRHGGLLEYRSEPGNTVFSVILPMAAVVTNPTEAKQ